MKKVLLVIVVFSIFGFFSCKNPLNESYTLIVQVGEGVKGTPISGNYSYLNGEAVVYTYSLEQPYENLTVTLNGAPVDNIGTFAMKENVTLIAKAELPERYSRSNVTVGYVSGFDSVYRDQNDNVVGLGFDIRIQANNDSEVNAEVQDLTINFWKNNSCNLGKVDFVFKWKGADNFSSNLRSYLTQEDVPPPKTGAMWIQFIFENIPLSVFGEWADRPEYFHVMLTIKDDKGNIYNVSDDKCYWFN